MDINKVESFVRAAESASLSEAAKHLHISQPAVSHQIKLLEKELGAALFIRSSTGLKLTDAGHLLLPWARRLLDDTNSLKEMMSSLQNTFIGELRIACSSTSGRYVLPLMVARFSKRYPGVQIGILSCRPASTVENLLEGEAHLGIVSTELNKPGLELQEFFRDTISLIVPCGHPWTGRESIEVSEILSQPIVMREESSGTRRVMMEQLSKFDINLEDLNVFLEIGNVEGALEVVAGGYGISFVSDLASQYMRMLGKVTKIQVEGLTMRRVNYLVRKQNAPPHRPRDVFWGFINDPENADLLRTRHAEQSSPGMEG